MIKDRQELLYEKFSKDAEENASTDGRKIPVTLKCEGCGAFHSEDVVKCGVCGAEADKLFPMNKDQFTPTDVEKKDSTTFTTFDSVEVNWTQEALDYLNEFPEGHVRKRAHAKIEKNARVQKIPSVSLSFAKEIINGKAFSVANGNGASAIETESKNGPDPDGFTWTPEATERLEQVPSGFMRDNTRTRVLDYARSIDETHITFDICVKGIQHSVEVMTEMIQNGATIEDFVPQKK